LGHAHGRTQIVRFGVASGDRLCNQIAEHIGGSRSSVNVQVNHGPFGFGLRRPWPGVPHRDAGDWYRAGQLHGIAAQVFLDRTGECWQEPETRYRHDSLHKDTKSFRSRHGCRA
jgi:hypothetical protein